MLKQNDCFHMNYPYSDMINIQKHFSDIMDATHFSILSALLWKNL